MTLFRLGAGSAALSTAQRTHCAIRQQRGVRVWRERSSDDVIIRKMNRKPTLPRRRRPQLLYLLLAKLCFSWPCGKIRKRIESPPIVKQSYRSRRRVMLGSIPWRGCARTSREGARRYDQGEGRNYKQSTHSCLLVQCRLMDLLRGL